MQSLPSGGCDGGVLAGEEEVARSRCALRGQVSIAGINGPRQTVISGSATAVAQICRALGERGIQHRLLPVSHAFHSPLVAPILDQFETAVGTVSSRRRACAWYRTSRAGRWLRMKSPSPRTGGDICAKQSASATVFGHSRPRGRLLYRDRSCSGVASPGRFCACHWLHRVWFRPCAKAGPTGSKCWTACPRCIWRATRWIGER